MLLPHRMPRLREIKLERIKRKKIENQHRRKVEEFLMNFDLDTKEILRCKAENIRIKEELEQNGKVTFGAFLWQQHLSAEYKFFARILGYIDGKTAEVLGELNFESHFLDENGYSEAHEKKLEEFIELDTRRKNIVNDYTEEIPGNSLTVINEAVKANPSSDRFAEVFKDNIDNNMQLPLQNQFVQAYNEGYLFARESMEAAEVFSRYNRNIELIKSKNKGKQKTYQI